MSDSIPSPDSEDLDSLASLPDSAPSDSIDSEDDRSRDADREWRENLQQIELVLSMIIIPTFGRYFGRKCAYWSTLHSYSGHFISASAENISTQAISKKIRGMSVY